MRKSFLYVGTKQVEARILCYETEENLERGFAKLQFNHKLFLVHDEPFIICSSGRTIGGGRVLNPINDPMKKRVKLELLRALNTKDFKNSLYDFSGHAQTRLWTDLVQPTLWLKS